MSLNMASMWYLITVRTELPNTDFVFEHKHQSKCLPLVSSSCGASIGLL